MSICFKTFQPTVLLSCEMEQKTCGAGKAIGRERETRPQCKIYDGSGAGDGLLLLNLPRDAIFIQDKLYSGAGTNIVLAASSFDSQGERGGLGQHAFKHLFFLSFFLIS